MNIVIAGASGFVGTAVVSALRAAGHDVRRLVRRSPSASDEIPWDPSRRHLGVGAVARADALINFGGENIAGGRWTRRRQEALRRSRLDTTATLIEARSATPSPFVLLNASAVGFYGDRGDETLDETSGPGTGFLAELCREWEETAAGAARLGGRVALLRLGMVLGPSGGALAKLQPIFRLGLGGRVGSGHQWMSWIHRDDVSGVVLAALRDERYRGAINVVTPNPVRNLEFSRALGTVLHRPTVVPAPAWALRLTFGRMADEALLASTRAVSHRLSGLGYVFKFPALGDALHASVAPRAN